MMDYAEFVSRIGFRFLAPQRRRPHGFRGLSKLLSRVGVHLEMRNTRLPEREAEIKRALRPVCTVPRMSTFAIGAIIHEGVRRMPAGQSFVNVGVWNGFTFLSGVAGNPDRRCVGVDSYRFPHSPKAAFLKRFESFPGRGPNHVFHEVDYRDYFKTVHQGPIGFYIYDGDHHYEHQLEGLRIAEPFLADGCRILIDDTGWDDAKRGTLDFIAQSRHRYRMLLDQATASPGHPTFWNGVMLFEKVA